jgi:hypothetical protein
MTVFLFHFWGSNAEPVVGRTEVSEASEDSRAYFYVCFHVLAAEASVA